MKNILNKIIIISASLLLVSCNSASVSKTYTQEGKLGYSIGCSGQDKDWGLCYQKAGSLCEDKGYDILDVTGEAGTTTDIKSSAVASSAKTVTTYNRIMIIQCREKLEKDRAEKDKIKENIHP